MPHHFPTVTFWITAVTWLGFAVWLGGWPDALLKAFDMPAATPSMRTEIRAFYGGLEAAIAVTMFLLKRQNMFSAALLVGGFPLAGSAIGRLVGLIIDGFSPTHLGFALLEAFGATLCIFASRRVSPIANC